MRWRMAHSWLTRLLVLLGLAAGCAEERDATPPGFQRVDPGTLVILRQAAESANLDLAIADLVRILEAMSGQEIPVVREDPGSAKTTVIWISDSEEARQLAGAKADAAYTLARLDDPGATRWTVAAADPAHLTFGVYAFCEELGVRFFHPLEEFVPTREGLFLPKTLAVSRRPAVALRGTQLHLLHPLEYFPSFNVASAEHLAEAKRLIDWLVKTGQNHLQWCLLSTVDWAGFKPHAQAILDYAHLRGVTVGAVAQLAKQASLQNALALIQDPVKWQADLAAGLTHLMELPWDGVELGLGEFLAANPADVIAWLDAATAALATTHPTVTLSVVNHVGNYPDLWVDYQGQKVFFYHLPGFADSRLVNTVHTLAFYDLYRDWAMYGHADFHLQRDFLKQQLPSRGVRYLPESAYWCSVDIDVPLFLPIFIYARWLDLHQLLPEIAAAGLPPLQGHVMFSSGHEWNYWLTDYLTARMLWMPAQPLEGFLAHYAGIFGAQAPAVTEVLGAVIELQNRFLFDRRRSGYLAGTDLFDDLGLGVGFETQPPRLPFAALLEMTPDERGAFEGEVVADLSALAAALLPLEERIAAICADVETAARSWCEELRDGIRIDRLRAEQVAALYRAALENLRAGSLADDLLGQAERTVDEAARVIQGREAHYRFDLDRTTGAFANPTIYPFGYLRQAHTQCLWRRDLAQAQHLIDHHTAAPATELASCLE